MADDNKGAVAAVPVPKQVEEPNPAHSVSAENDSEQEEDAGISDEWMDQEPNKSMWDNYYKQKKIDKKLKDAEQKRDEEEAQAKKDGKARTATGGAGPSGS